MAKKAGKKVAKKVGSRGAKVGGARKARVVPGKKKGAVKASAGGVMRATGGSRLGVDQIVVAREVFWQNMMRELLTSLSVLCSQIASRRAAVARLAVAGGSAASGGGASADGVASGMIGRAAGGAGGDGGDGEEEEGEDEPTYAVPETVGREPGNVFDGRLAVITTLGQRIPIAEVHPVFACGVRGPDGSNLLSTMIECSVFEIRTPGGEVWTLPIHEIKAFHALTPELVEELGKAMGVEEGGEAGQPFGFAAFTSLARNQGALSEVPMVEREWQGE